MFNAIRMLPLVGSITGSAFIDAQNNQISYFVQNFMKASGESIGLPKATPDRTKLDYVYRGTYLTTMLAFNQNFWVQVVDYIFNQPLMYKHLKLENLSAFYEKNRSFHTPKGIKIPIDKRVNFQEFPGVLIKRMLGYMVNAETYHTVPGILDSIDLEKAIRYELKLPANKPLSKVNRVLYEEKKGKYQLLSHFLERIFAPRSYITGLKQEGKINAVAARRINRYLDYLETLVFHFEAIRPEQVSTIALAELKKHPIIPKQEVVNTPIRAFLRYLVPKWILPHKPLSYKEYQTKLKALNDTPIRQLMNRMQTLRHELPRDNRYLNYLTKLSEIEFMREIKGDSDWLHRVSEANGHKYKLFRFKVEQEFNDFIKRITDKVFVPSIESLHGPRCVEARLFKDMSQAMVMGKQIKQFHKNSQLLKTLMVVASSFIMYGLVGGFVDNQYVLPYQRKVGKIRGDTNELQWPVYLGMVPCFGAFLALRKILPRQGLANVISYGTASLGGMAAYTASVLYMISSITKQSRDTPFWTKMGLNPWTWFDNYRPISKKTKAKKIPIYY